MRTISFCWTFTLLMAACSSQEGQWKHSSIKTKNPAYHSNRLVIKSSNKFRGIELEIIKSQSAFKGYLNIHSLTFTPLPNDPYKCIVSLTTNSETRHYSTDILKGQQRLLLPEEALSFIISSLRSNTTISVSTGRFQSELY